MSCGDYFGAHGHDEAGAIQIFRGAPLSTSDGTYDNFDSNHWANYYSQHSVHANTIAVHMPGEVFPNSKTLQGGPNVNDGGQRPLRRLKDGSGFSSPDLATYMKNKTSGSFYETGDLKTFEHAQCHDYVACDITAAYSSPGFTTNGNAAKVNEAFRQVVFMPPKLVVVFDRVESTDASYEKRVLWHAQTAPTVNGSTFTIVNGAGRLVGQTVLPASASLNVVTGFTVDGAAYPPNGYTDPEQGGTRVEVVPKQAQTRDYFLHVLDAADSKDATMPQVTLAEDAASATVTIQRDGGTYVLKLAKTGAPGGHITVNEPNGTKCDQDLGAQGTGPGDDGGTSPDGGNPSGDDGGANGDTGGGSSGGCGCSVVASGGGAEAIVVLALGASLVRLARRRRRH
jgi:hypothetical protein